MKEITTEQIAQNYAACIDSVNLLDRGQLEGMSDEEWADTQDRNVRHLEIMAAKDYWTTEDISVITAVIESV
jgi:hypothetical protein